MFEAEQTFSEAFVAYAEEFTDCPSMFLRWGAYLAISAVLGPKCLVRTGIADPRPNLWVILLGGASMHKSTALKICTSIIREVRPELALAQEWSHEKLLQDIQQRPHCLMVYDEARSFFSACEKKYNEGIQSALTTLWHEQDYLRTTKAGTIEIHDAYVCFGGASTPEWLNDSIRDKGSAIMSGFLPRFILVPAPKTNAKCFPFPPPADRSKKIDLVRRLFKIAELEGEARYASEARTEYEVWYREYRDRIDRADPLAQPFLAKHLEIYSHRLAMVMAADFGTYPEITLGVWREAKHMLGYLERNVQEIIRKVTEKDWDRERTKIATAIEESSEISQTNLSRRTHIFGQRLRGYVDDLEGAGLIETVKITQKDAKKPTTLIRWLDVAKNGNE